MEHWKNHCTKNNLRPFVFQFLISGLYSFMGMFLMSCLLLVFFINQNKGCEYGVWDECIFNLLFIIFLFNNVNLIFLIITHLLKILPFFIYYNLGVFLEGGIYYLIVYVSVYIYSFDTLLGSVIPTLVFFVVLLPLKLFVIRANKCKILRNSTYRTNKYFFGEKTDILFCLFLPSIPLIIILINILAGI